MYAATNRRRTSKDEIRLKAKALRAAQRRLAQLQAENDWLRWQHQLIAEMCKGFDWFRHHKLHSLLSDPELLMQAGSQLLTRDSLQQQLSSCLATADEAQLLQELSTLPDVQQQPSLDAVAGLALNGSNPLQGRSYSVHSSSPSASSSHTRFPASNSSIQQPIAPPDDPLYLFQYVFGKPAPAACSRLATITLQELAGHYKSLVCQLSLYLMQLQTGGMAAEDQPLQKLQETLCDHLRLMCEACIANSSLVAALQLTNCETGEQLSEPPTERIRWVAERLELSPQQQVGIARGVCVFKKLLTPVLEELRQLQQQQVEEDPSACLGKGSKTAAEPCSSYAADAAQQYSISSERGRLLEQQEQRSGRMQLLLHKDYFLRTWFSGYLYGQLSWIQLARLHVLMLPFYPVPFVFFKEVEAQVAARLAKRAEVDESKEEEVL